MHAVSWFLKEGFSHIDHFVENSKIINIIQESNGAICNTFPAVSIRCEQIMNVYCFSAVMNHVAEALGMDPVKLALMHDGCDGRPMSELGEWKRERGFKDRDSLKECLEAGKKAVDWDNKWHLPGTKKLPNGKMHGLGIDVGP